MQLCVHRDNTYGTFAVAGVGFSEDHGGSASANPPTNATATPRIRNMAVVNMALSVMGPSVINTLAEAPIENLTLRNITLTAAHSGARTGWTCAGQDGTKEVGKIFATGTIEAVSPPLGRCSFIPPPPPRICRIARVLGCYNDSGKHSDLLPFGDTASVHDHVTHGNCASLCANQHLAVAGIDQGNHCRCGSNASLAAADALGLRLPSLTACQSREWPCTGACCGPHAHPDCDKGACTGAPAEQCGGVGALLAYSFECKPPA